VVERDEGVIDGTTGDGLAKGDLVLIKSKDGLCDAHLPQASAYRAANYS
jgi:hypothetical protein